MLTADQCQLHKYGLLFKIWLPSLTTDVSQLMLMMSQCYIYSLTSERQTFVIESNKFSFLGSFYTLLRRTLDTSDICHASDMSATFVSIY